MNKKDQEIMNKIEKLTAKAVVRGWKREEFKELVKFLEPIELTKYHSLNLELKGRLEKEVEMLEQPKEKLSRVELLQRGQKTPKVFKNVSGVFMEEGHLIIEVKNNKEKFCDVCHLSEINYWREVHV